MTTDAVPGVADPAEGPAVPEPSAPNIIELPDGHHVTLAPDLSVPLGMAALVSLQQAVSGGLRAIEYALTELWLGIGPDGNPYTIREWDFLDPQGNPEPITSESITRLLPFDKGGLEVSEGCAALYGAKVMRPFVERLGKLLPNTRTGNGTRPTSLNGAVTRKPSRRSSPKNSAAGRRSGVRGR